MFMYRERERQMCILCVPLPRHGAVLRGLAEEAGVSVAAPGRDNSLYIYIYIYII